MKNILPQLGIGFFAILSIVMTSLYWLERNATVDQMVATTTSQDSQASLDQRTMDAFSSDEVEEVQLPATYEAKVGKFNLALDNIYAVVVNIDGDFEGGPSTQIEVARRVSGSQGVLTTFVNDYVKIEAFPTKTQGTRDQFVTSDTILQSSAARESRTKIDEVEARSFAVETLGKTEKIYFENNGITYLIEAWDTGSSDTRDMLNDVVRGFSFQTP